MTSDEGDVAKERLLVAPDCSKLVDTLAVAITLAIGASEAGGPASELVARVEVSAPEPVDPAESRAVAPRTPDAGEAQTEAGLQAECGPGARPSVLLAGVFDGGSLPAPALGVSVGAELRWQHVGLRALGTLLFDQQVRLAAASGDLGAELGLAFGTLQGCISVFSNASAWSLPFCVGGDIGRGWVMLAATGSVTARPPLRGV